MQKIVQHRYNKIDIIKLRNLIKWSNKPENNILTQTQNPSELCCDIPYVNYPQGLYSETIISTIIPVSLRGFEKESE